jgi:hypothetical protein
MADRLVGPIKFSGEFGKIPKVIFSYLLVDSVSGEAKKDRKEESDSHLIFPDCVDLLSESEKIDLYYYIREWFMVRDANALENIQVGDKKEYIGEGGALDAVLKGVIVDSP